jgi:hypothetical protein
MNGKTRFGRTLKIILGGAIVGAVLSSACSPSIYRSKAFACYYDNDLVNSEKYFREYLSHARRDTGTELFYAENLRRLGKYDSALAIARKVLKNGACNSMASQVIGNVMNPQYGNDSGKLDTSWYYLRKSVECDSNNGMSWLGVWILSLYFHDQAMEQKSLAGLYRSGFYTPSVYAENEWMLRDLPPNAILFVNGDNDMYPAKVLQSVKKFRSDVLVVNVSLMNLDWFLKTVRTALNLDTLFTDDAISSLKPAALPDGTYKYIAQQAIEKLISLRLTNELDRPVAFSATLDNASWGPFAPHLTNKGAYYSFRNDSTGYETDTEFIYNSLKQVDIARFTGRNISEHDKSPVRRKHASDVGAGYLLVCCAGEITLMYARDGQKDKTAELLAWMEAFESKTRHNTRMDAYIKDIRQKYF